MKSDSAGELHQGCKGTTAATSELCLPFDRMARQPYFCVVKYATSFDSIAEDIQEEDVLVSNAYGLIVWNDDVNTFDWVIQTLVEVCKHTPEQAEQCAMLIHTKGKYNVKQGDREALLPPCTAITDRGISATVEELV